MAARMQRTRTPGVYKRGSRYVFVYRCNGKQRWESCRTLEDARRAKQARATDIERGEFEPRSRLTLHEYAREWVLRYNGRGRRGFRDATRDEYSRLLEQYALRHFSERARLTEITPSAITRFVAWLCNAEAQGRRAAEMRRKAKAEKLGVPPNRLALTEDGKPPAAVVLSDKTVRNALGPLRACLASAVREGLLRSNPAREADLPHRPGIEDDGEVVRALTRTQLATFLRLAPERHRLLFELLASTGLRISEAVALQWRHIHLDGSSPHVKVRRAIVRDTVGPPKTRYSRRDVPISDGLVVKLRCARRDSEWPDVEDPVFPSLRGSSLQPDNLRRRAFKPTAEEAGVPWAAFHTLRHTCASLLFAEGRNAVQVQRWLGHHSAAFTLATYVHLLDGDLGEPLTLESELCCAAMEDLPTALN